MKKRKKKQAKTTKRRMIAAVQEKAGKLHVIDLNKLLLELRAVKPRQEDRIR